MYYPSKPNFLHENEISIGRYYLNGNMVVINYYIDEEHKVSRMPAIEIEEKFFILRYTDGSVLHKRKFKTFNQAKDWLNENLEGHWQMGIRIASQSEKAFMMPPKEEIELYLMDKLGLQSKVQESHDVREYRDNHYDGGGDPYFSGVGL